jgi:hypothetical protein
VAVLGGHAVAARGEHDGFARGVGGAEERLHDPVRHRIPMDAFADQVPAFDAVRITVARTPASSSVPEGGHVPTEPG